MKKLPSLLFCVVISLSLNSSPLLVLDNLEKPLPSALLQPIPDDYSVTPDMGSDEFESQAVDVALLEIVAPSGGCRMTSAEQVTLLLMNTGLTTISGGLTASFRFNGSMTVVTESVSGTILPGDSLLFTFTTLVNMYVYTSGVAQTFEIEAWTTLIGDMVPSNDSLTLQAPSFYTPLPPIAYGTTIPYNSSATLTASSPDSVMWYLTDTCTVPLHRGAAFTTPLLYSTTTFRVGASTSWDGSPPGQYIPGPNLAPQAVVTASSCYSGPCSSLNNQNLGFCGTQQMYIYFTNPINPTPHVNWIDFTWPAQVTIDGLTIHHGDATTRVLTGGDLYYWHAGAWVWFHTFSNLPMQCENVVRFPLVTTNQLRITTFQMTGTGQQSMPNFREIEVHQGFPTLCESYRMPVTVTVGQPPPVDAGIEAVVNPPVNVTGNMDYPVQAVLRNYGSDTLHSVTISWSVNSILQGTFIWSGPLAHGKTQTLTIDTVPVSGGEYCIDVWTTMPNGVADPVASNDTATRCINACLTGTYTIGTATTGSWNYNSFNAALDDIINFGICGHVVFEVQPGTYTEQLTIGYIEGMDENNTVTFRGAVPDSTSAVLQHSAVLASNWTVRLVRASYFNFEYLTIRANGTFHGRVFEFREASSHIRISNCALITNTNIGSTYYQNTIFAQGTTTNPGCDNITITHSRLSGGSTCVSWNWTTHSRATNFFFSNNLVENFLNYGVYVYYTDSVFITSNTILKQSSLGTTYSLYVGYMPSYGEICKNFIGATSTNTHYGITLFQCYSTQDPFLVANNMVTHSGGTSNSVHGMRISGSIGVNVFNNTIRIAGGSVSDGVAFSLFGHQDINIVNNIFSNFNSGYAAYFNSPAGVSTCDNNNYYTSGVNLAYWGANVSDLAALQLASGKDQNSHEIDPPFVSATDLHLATTALSAKGVALPEVYDDFDGEPRPPIPAIGADEPPLIPIDAGVIAILNPVDSTVEGQQYPVKLVIANFGLDSIYTMDVQYQVDNLTPVVVTYTGALGSLDTAHLMMPPITSALADYDICVKTLLLNDTNFYNDEYCKTFYGMPLYDATLLKTMGPVSGCGLGMDTVKIWVRNLGVNAINHPTPSSVTVSYQLNGSLPVVTENFISVLQPNDSVLFLFNTFADFSATSQVDSITITAWTDLAGDSMTHNDTARYQLVSLPIPALPVVNSPVAIPYASQVTLTAFSPTNDVLKWYATATDSTEIQVGSGFTTPILYQDTTYWVEAVSETSIVAEMFTSGMLVITEQCHYRSPTGAPVGGWPTWLLADDYIEITGPPNIDLGGIILEQWSETAQFGSHTFPAGTILSPDGIAIIAVGQLLTSQPSPANFYYHGNGTYTGTFGSNTKAGRILKNPNGTIIDAVGYSNFDFPAAANVPASEWYDTVTTSTGLGTAGFRLVGPDDNTGNNWVVSSAQYPQDPYVLNSGVSLPKRNGCASSRVPINVAVSGPATCDIGVVQILQPASALNLTSQETISIKVRNYGTTSQSNIPVSYRIDNQSVVSETLAGPLDPNDSVVYVFNAPANLSSSGATYLLKAWTSLACDSTPQNDTACKSVTNMLHTYCISSATSSANQEIVNVTLGSMNNTSPANGAIYTDHTLSVPPAVLSPGLNYTLSITSGFAPGAFTQQNCWVKVWIDFNRDGIFDTVNELAYSSATTSSNTLNASIQIPYAALTGNTVLRIVLNQTTVEANVSPCGTYANGETEDYLVTIAAQPSCDAGVVAISQPSALTPSGVPQPVLVRFMNFGTDTIAPNTLSVAYSLNGGVPVTATIPGGLAPGMIDSIQMPPVSIPMGNNTLCAYTILACDSTQFNNEMCKAIYGEYHTNLPYFDDFEASNNWYKPAEAINWQYGTPVANIIDSAWSGTKAWVTNLSGDYTNNASEHIYSPIFNFSGLGYTDTVTLSFFHWLAMASGDYGYVQYSINGNAYANLGIVADPAGTNWYNAQVGGVSCFSQTNSGWINSAYRLTPAIFNGYAQVRFRFHFFSNASGTSNGWAIDNFRLELPAVPNDVGVSAIQIPYGDTATGTPVNAVVTISNYGTAIQSMIPIELRVDNNIITTETWTGVLPGQSNINYTFVLPFNVPVTPYQLCAKTNLPGDSYAINDQFCKSLGVEPAFHDVGVMAIVAPQTDTNDRICFHAPWYNPSLFRYDVIVRIKNFGQNTQTAIPVKYSFYSGSTVYTDIWTGTLLPGDTVDFELSNEFLPLLGNQQVCVETALIGDPVSANDKTCKYYIGVNCIPAVDDQDASGFALYQNIPNPAKGTTIIGYRVPQGGDVTFGLVSMIGQVLHSELQTVSAGEQQTELDVSSLAAGIYYYFVEFDGQRLTMKLVVNK